MASISFLCLVSNTIRFPRSLPPWPDVRRSFWTGRSQNSRVNSDPPSLLVKPLMRGGAGGDFSTLPLVPSQLEIGLLPVTREISLRSRISEFLASMGGSGFSMRS